jgi:fructosamine-3-kinase
VSHSKAIQKYSTAAIVVYKFPVENIPQETYKIEANQAISSGPDNFDSIRVRGQTRMQDTDLQGTSIDKKASTGLHQETQHARNMIKKENELTHLREASHLSQQFHCYYCEQRFLSQSELIAHMDKESADAREKQQDDVEGY